jgi:hypothetical protein
MGKITQKSLDKIAGTIMPRQSQIAEGINIMLCKQDLDLLKVRKK